MKYQQEETEEKAWAQEKIPAPWWLGMVFLGIAILLILPSSVTGLTNQSNIPLGVVVAKSIFGAALALCVFYPCGFSFQLDAEYLHCYWYWIPVRHVKWAEIKQIGVVRSGGELNRCILITTGNCPCFAPQREHIDRYFRRHLCKVILIMGAEENRPKVEKFYGPLDYEV